MLVALSLTVGRAITNRAGTVYDRVSEVTAVPSARDPGETAATLTAWLATIPAYAGARVDNVSIPQATGWSNETIFFDAHVTRDGAEHTDALVVRIAPRDYQVFLEPDFERQFTVMALLGEHTDVPAARVRHLERDERWFGNPFWIMERVAGRIAGDAPPYSGAGWLHDATAAEQAHAWQSGIDAMVAIHRLDAGRFMPAFDNAMLADPLGWQLDFNERYLTWAEDGTPHPLARAALSRLRAERPAAPREGAALVWGDARFSNLIYRDFDVIAVLDWEMSAIGDPLLDLGWWLFADAALTKGSGNTRLPGFPSAAETARTWSDATGRATDALDYYVLFAGLRFTVIMLRMGKLLHDIGFVPAGFAYDNLISTALGAILDGEGLA